MYNFFVKKQNRNGNFFIISDSDYNHIKNVLRMKLGDTLLISCDSKSHLCEIKSFENDVVIAEILEENYFDTSLTVDLYLFQGLPKSDKMEFIIQKAVELGVKEIIPTEMEHCVVKLEQKKKEAKRTRWQSISESAAKQSKRNEVPQVTAVLSLKEALEKARALDAVLVPYENAKGMAATKEALQSLRAGMSVGIFIGPEGGFSEAEIEEIKGIGASAISLGKRILRTETAAIASLSMCMLYAETELNDDNASK
ncbi:MAG: 16S rRNA (uracil(1498)-N(3))-methyltransferase [Ruminococcaceae bacterium]|nr:16S rRNA (uracil(1498)-N(3))-methyltransferase [Oscillospiraceae bacterium]